MAQANVAGPENGSPPILQIKIAPFPPTAPTHAATRTHGSASFHPPEAPRAVAMGLFGGKGQAKEEGTAAAAASAAPAAAAAAHKAGCCGGLSEDDKMGMLPDNRRKCRDVFCCSVFGCVASERGGTHFPGPPPLSFRSARRRHPGLARPRPPHAGGTIGLSACTRARGARRGPGGAQTHARETETTFASPHHSPPSPLSLSPSASSGSA
jgi:hypothetical protein